MNYYYKHRKKREYVANTITKANAEKMHLNLLEERRLTKRKPIAWQHYFLPLQCKQQQKTEDEMRMQWFKLPFGQAQWANMKRFTGICRGWRSDDDIIWLGIKVQNDSDKDCVVQRILEDLVSNIPLCMLCWTNGNKNASKKRCRFILATRQFCHLIIKFD